MKKILTISAIAIATQFTMANMVAVIMSNKQINYNDGGNPSNPVTPGDDNLSPVVGINHPWLLYAQSKGQLTSKTDVSAYESFPVNFNNIMGRNPDIVDLDLPQYDIGVKNLYALNFAGNSLTHIDFINGIETIGANGGVSYLNVSDNLLSDISGLNDLISLDDNGTIDLSRNKISELNSLSNLVSADILNFSQNDINDISGLSNVLKINKINLSDNKISDISPIQNAIISKNLNISYNNISDISMLKFNDKTIDSITLNDNNISDISIFSNMNNLNILNINNNNISDLSFFTYYKSMTNNLYAYGNNLTNLRGLENVREIDNLDVGGNGMLNDLSALKYINRIGYFNLNGVSNGLKDLNDLESITELDSVNGSNTEIENVDALYRITSIFRYDFLNNQSLNDLSGLSNISEITGFLRIYNPANITTKLNKTSAFCLNYDMSKVFKSNNGGALQQVPYADLCVDDNGVVTPNPDIPVVPNPII